MAKLFDAQVNYGRSAIGPDCDIQLYLQNMAHKVSGVLLIPSPTHDHVYGDGTREVSCMWELKQGAPEYTVKVISSGQESIIVNPVSPYARFNKHVVACARELTTSTGINFYVAAKCHPKLDTRECIEELTRMPEVRAIKIHGLATHSTPNDVPSWLPALARDANIPFFIHTDFYLPSPNPSSLQHLMQQNTAKAWYDWAKKHDVRAFLAHGLRLDIATLEKTRGDPNILVGAGPVSLIENEPDRLMVKTDDYLTTLLSHTDASNIAFCTDYRWNVQERNAWDELDWTSDLRLSAAAQKLHLGTEAITAMLHGNAARFFSRD